MLKDSRDMFQQTARVIVPNYNSLTTNELANMYVDAENNDNKHLMNGCVAGLMCKYFPWTRRWVSTCDTLQMFEDDFIDWLEHAVMYTLEHKAWLNPKSSLYGDPNGPDKAFNVALGTMRAMKYQEANKDCRKSNTQVVSVEDSIDENGDCALDNFGCVEEAKTISGAAEAIKYYVKRDQPIEALILYSIADGYAQKKIKKTANYMDVDSTGKEVKKRLAYHQEDFDKRKLVQHLNAIDAEEMAYFCETYSMDSKKGEALLPKLQQMDNPQFYKYLKKLIIECRNDPDQTVLKCLCK